MPCPTTEIEQSLFSRGWTCLTSEDMLLNLTSEAVGILVTFLIIQLAGGWFVQRSIAKSFDKKWATFRGNLAESILERQDQLDQDYFDLGKEMKRISEKPIEGISDEDLTNFRMRREACRSGSEYLQSIFEKSHFALRDSDVEPATAYISKLRTDISEKLSDSFSVFEQFDTRLAMHAQNITPLGSYIGQDKSQTYADAMRNSAASATTLISNTDTAGILQLGRELAAALQE